MSKAYNSPTARILQHSRLFSLPRPLPQPNLESLSTNGIHRASETATLPYPVHQAIATPTSSHHRGDWGLKRPLPGKTTKTTSAPVVRVLAQDTSDHITDFESAGDHVRTVQKWSEMGVPLVDKRITKPGSQTIGLSDGIRSVYEEDLDNTDPNAADVAVADGQGLVRRQRWKYSGPHIGGMQEVEFEQYLAKNIDGSQQRWLNHVREYFASDKFNNERMAARQAGRHFGPLETAMPEAQVETLRTRLEEMTQPIVDEALRDFETRMAKEEDEAALEGNDNRAQREERRNQVETEARARAAETTETLSKELEQCTREAEKWRAFDEARAIMADADRNVTVTKARNETKRRELEKKRKEDYDAGFAEAEHDYQFDEKQAAATLARIVDVAARNVLRVLSIEAPPQSTEEAESTNEAEQMARNALRELTFEQRNLIQAKRSAQARWESELLASFRPDRAQLAEYQKELRAEHKEYKLSSTLSKLITRFLDLPSIHDEDAVDKSIRSRVSSAALANHLTATVKIGDHGDGPPSTHGGAGLSYVRTNAVMENHPIHGPQWKRSPILARVLKARQTTAGSETFAKLGVAGFVANDSETGTSFDQRGKFGRYDPTQVMDPNAVGGGKVWVHPEYAYVDQSGHVQLRLRRGDPEAVAVRMGEVEEIQQKKEQALTGPRARTAGAGDYASLPPQSGANYGTALPNQRLLAQQEARAAAGPRVVSSDPRPIGGYTSARAGNSGEETTASQRIKNLMSR